ncbi:hypothetical protein AnigIFM50267_003210 [Aspergillus niger]|nr:hypothetical protein AnigIFM50267_003210 [Aspergillus niger]
MEVPYKSIHSGRLRISLAIWAIPSRLSQRPALHAVANTTGKPERLEEPGDKLELLIKVDDEKEMSYLEERQALFVTVAWRSGCFSGPLPTELLGKAFARVQNQPKTGQGLNGSEIFRQASILNSEAKWGKHVDIPRKWRSFAQLCNEAHGMPRGIMSEQDMNARFPPDMRHECPPGSIFAYTQSLDLNQLILSTRRGRFGRKVIVIEFGDFVPEIIPGAINLERINHVRQNSPNSLFTLLALSITEDKHSMTRSGPPKEEVSWYDSAGEILGDGTPQPIEIELMLVETENGVSRRVGLAWAYLKSWINQNPQFRTFHLV